MNLTFNHQRTSVLAALALTLLVATAVAAQDQKTLPAAAAKSADSTESQAAAKPPARSADQVVAASIAAMKNFETITADLSEAVRMGTQQFSASGRYTQGQNNRLRISMVVQPVRQLAVPVEEESPAAKSGNKAAPKAAPPKNDEKVSEKPNAVLHVCDGQVLWTQWTIDGKSSVERRDVKEILKAVSGPGPTDPSAILANIGLGGVPALLNSLKQRMVFQGVREQDIDGHKFVVVQGRWNDEQMRRFVPPNAQGQPNVSLPAYIPEYVRVYFEEETLFPRRIMYLKRHPNPEENTAAPMITLDFTNVVVNGPVDAEQFDFKAPNARNQTDITDDLIKALKPAASRARTGGK